MVALMKQGLRSSVEVLNALTDRKILKWLPKEQIDSEQLVTGKIRSGAHPDTALQIDPEASGRILCVVLTEPGNHATRATAVVETWGQLFVSLRYL